MATVKYTEEAFNKMRELVLEYNTEIGWHGVVEKKSENEYLITDILLYPQLVTSCTVETDNIKYAKWFQEGLMKDYNKYNNIKMQGHSHVHMGVTPSGTDLQHQEEIYNQMKEGDYYIFTIWNKYGEHNAWIYTK